MLWERPRLESIGSDLLGGTTEDLYFAYATLTGDGTVTARIDGFYNANGNSVAGVMIRETLDSNSAFALAGRNKGNASIYRHRLGAGQNDGMVFGTGGPDRKWIRLEKQGNTIRSSVSFCEKNKFPHLQSFKVRQGLAQHTNGSHIALTIPIRLL